MTMFSSIILSTLAAVLTMVQTQQVVPIPTRPQGFPYQQSTCKAPVHIEIHTDLICPNCKEEFSKVLDVADYYGAENVSLNLLMFPLPYHRAAYLAAQGTFIVDSLSNGSATYAWMKTMFDNQDKFYNFNIMDRSQDDLVDLLAKYAGMSGVDSKAFKNRMVEPSDPSAYEAVVQWKYGASRTVSGTPFTFINGVFVPAFPTWTLKDWQQVIDPLLGLNYRKYKDSKGSSCPSGQVECEYLPGKTQCCLAGENCIPNVGCRC